MKVIGHQHPTDDQKSHFFPEAGQLCNKAAPEAVRDEQRSPPVSAAIDELHLPRSVMAVVERHGKSEYASVDRRPQVKSLRKIAPTHRRAGHTCEVSAGNRPMNRGVSLP